MDSLVSLPRWLQFVLAVVLVLVAGEIVSRIAVRVLTRWRASAHRASASASDGSQPQPRSYQDHLHNHHDEAQAPPNLRDDDPDAPPAIVDSWGRPRTICPCCGYPTARETTALGACLLCDWDDPLAESSEPGVARSEYAMALARARDNLTQFGSAITPDDRRASAGGLLREEQQLRDRLRSDFDYLMTAERPDASETWERVDGIIAELQSLERSRQDRRPR